MHFVSGENRQRSRQFDAVVEATVGVLEHPTVKQELGKYGARLLIATNRLVLPNIHNGKAIFPKKSLLSDSFGLVPLRREEQNGGLRMDPSMYEATLRRRSNRSAQEVRQIASYIAKQEPQSPIVTAPGHTDATIYKERQYVSRPLIFLHPLMVDGEITSSRARTVLHELVHADDADSIEEDYDVCTTVNLAKDEIHAYCVEAVAERAMLGSVTSDFEVLSKPLRVEALNIQYGNPSTPTEELIWALQDHMII